ncbi:MAG: hypothetical protein ABSF44_13250 [Candidatus Bathyarchaeia archaeon]|jgi:hypothetical protein
MYRKWTFKYGVAAVLAAILVIAVAMFANPSFLPKVSAKSNFAIMLTDPPTVPAGTTQLNFTYSALSLHVVQSDGTSQWLSVAGSGTVNSFALVNLTQTLASATIPFNSTVDKVQFTIANVKAEINGTSYDLTTLSDTMVLQIANAQVNQTLSGVLVDFNPTLVQIRSDDANGNPVSYYVLVPSANAVVVNGLSSAQIRVGTIVKLGEYNRERMIRVVQSVSSDLSISSASLSVKGNVTSLSVTMQNSGDITFRIFGVALSGEFNTPFNQPDFYMPGVRMGQQFGTTMMPFRINGTSLVPPFGPGLMQPMIPHDISSPSVVGTSYEPQTNGPFLVPMERLGMGRGMQPINPITRLPDDRTGAAESSYVVVQPGQSVTLSFTGVVSLPYGFLRDLSDTSITPIVGNSYTIQLSGEGFQTASVTATAAS